jgi:phage tail sheath protein FI
MASVSFHHGTRVFQSGETPVLVRTAQTAVIGLIGTAPEADAEKFPLNKPVQILRTIEADGLGDDGTLKEALDSIFDQVGCPIILVRIAEGQTTAETWGNLVGDQIAFTGVHAFRRARPDGLYKPKLLLAPGFTQTTPADGIASINVTAGGSGYHPDTVTVTIAGAGTGAKAKAVVDAGVVTSIIVTNPGAGYSGSPTATIGNGLVAATANATIADGKVTAVTIVNPGAGYTSAPTISFSGGGGSDAAATAVVVGGKVVEITITNEGTGYVSAPSVSFTGGGGTGATANANKGSVINPVVTELMGVAETLKAIAYVDGPDMTDQAAVQYRGLINSGRIFVCDPKVLKFDTESDTHVPQPSSPVWAARQARMDLEQGFWWAGSNVEVAGITGINRPIEYGPQANYLNEHRVNTIVNIDNTGFRLWGVWTCDSDLLWQFVSVRRTADAINEALEAAYLEFVDRPFSKANLKFMIEAGRAFLRTMELEGAILPGSDVWLLDSNTDVEMAQGIVKLGVKFEPPAPMVDIRLTAYRNIAAYTLLLNQVAQEINDGALAA